MLRVNWKDHGYGNNKGHLWARIAPDEWRQISKHVADHDWRTDVLHLPKEFFQLDSEQARVLELATESHYSDKYVWSDTSGYEIHIAPGSRLIMRRSKNEEFPDDMVPVRHAERRRQPVYLLGGHVDWEVARQE